ncbi:NTTRR-F1 domain [Longirhabdus pacifica]|uniref:NTTRR-F1 domain n=1 Tax=Longirhabdus pacifica TaxID=2305227 RepID=UPI0013E8E755|nr:NTTRR-F1 domain [Longirhabdus pacifica]
MSSKNLIQNGNFSNELAYWKSINSTVVPSPSDPSAHCAQLAGTVNSYIYQEFAIQPDESYSIQLMIAKQGAGMGPNVLIQLQWIQDHLVLETGMSDLIPINVLPNGELQPFLFINTDATLSPKKANKARLLINKLPLSNTMPVLISNVEVATQCSLNELECGSDCTIGPLSPLQRRQEAFKVRTDAALFEKNKPVPNHPCNHDEQRFANKIASFSKALPHNQLGEVDLSAYNQLTQALTTGNTALFEQLKLGGTVKLVNPQASYAYQLVGPDMQQVAMPAAPEFSSAWQASETAEVYWQALARDVNFSQYHVNPITNEAAADLSTFSDFRGPKENGKVTTNTLFRGSTPGDLKGPYISQFLFQDIPMGSATFEQRYRTTLPGTNFLTDYKEWLNVQNGEPPSFPEQFDPTPRYIRNGRDLANYVHIDYPFQEYVNACLLLLSYGSNALDPADPYIDSKTQYGFVTFGAAHYLDFAARASRVGLIQAWFQKWRVHRRLRPEAFGGAVQNKLTGAANYPINEELLNSPVLKKIFNMYYTYLLPTSYPEGSPTHPSYPAGHATNVGAGATILKALFNEYFIIPNPVVPTPDGLYLVPYEGPPLTVGGELDKLAYNVAIGRDFAGIHYRSDAEGLEIGEEAAIGILQDYRETYNEGFEGFKLTKFDGTTITI